MTHTTSYVIAGIAAASAMVTAAPAQATQEDTQFWTWVTLEHALTEDLDASLELARRFREDGVGGDQSRIGAAMDYRIAPNVTAGAGITFVDFEGGHETRPHQQVNFAAGQLRLRTRLEQRFFSGADRVELRVRQRAQIAFPLGEDTALVTSGEFFAILQSRSEGRGSRVDQLRANLTVRHELAPNLSAGAGYLLIFVPRQGAPDRVSHVPQLSLSWEI